MNKIAFKNRFLVSVLVFVLLLIVISILLVWPSLKEIRLITRQVYEERIRLEKLYVRGQLQKRVRDNYAKIQDQIGFLDDLWLKENQELPYITAIEQAAAEQNIDLKIAIGQSKRLPEQPFSVLAMNFTLAGQAGDILRWLERLETLPYYTNFKEISIAVRERENNEGRGALVTVSAETYWLLP